MANLYTSDLIVPSSDPVEILIAEVALTPSISLEVNKFTSGDQLIGTIIPPVSYVENCIENQTRIRVFLSSGQVEAGEKIQVKLNN